MNKIRQLTKDWKNIGKRLFEQVKVDNIVIIAGGVAFYLYLSLFPAIIAFIGFYGLFTEPEAVNRQMTEISSFIPEQAQAMVSKQLSRFTEESKSALGLGVVFSILLGLWSANNGTRAIFKGVTIAYNRENTRNFLQSTWITILFTVSGIIVVILSIVMVAGFPALIGKLELPSFLETIANLIRWLILAVIIYFSITTIYRFAPQRSKSEFQWLNWGGAIATGLWLLGSGGFSLFVRYFGNLDQIFGSVGTIIILMLWFLLSSFSILVGAEINSVLDD